VDVAVNLAGEGTGNEHSWQVVAWAERTCRIANTRMNGEQVEISVAERLPP